jgi:hypothetical protein
MEEGHCRGGWFMRSCVQMGGHLGGGWGIGGCVGME